MNEDEDVSPCLTFDGEDDYANLRQNLGSAVVEGCVKNWKKMSPVMKKKRRSQRV